ncbi:hypothetical protein [Aromatoleum diolicum]|uniref:hypothetical protein n=1 Tax=Aromatoleum diolicum TaxID=75796 RepID=UPI001B7CF747|nr:hypothetical protein [Aromatoleum diolicum]
MFVTQHVIGGGALSFLKLSPPWMAARVCEAVANHRRSLKHLPKTADEYLDTLFKQDLTRL